MLPVYGNDVAPVKFPFNYLVYKCRSFFMRDVVLGNLGLLGFIDSNLMTLKVFTFREKLGDLLGPGGSSDKTAEIAVPDKMVFEHRVKVSFDVTALFSCSLPWWIVVRVFR